MVSFNGTQKRNQGITQSYTKSLSSHISVQDRETLGSAKAHLPSPAMRPAMTTWCLLLAPPSQTRQRWRKPVGLSPSASFHNLSSLYSTQMLQTEQGAPYPCRAQPGAPSVLRSTKPCADAARGEEVRGLCPALPCPGCPAPQPGRH